MKFTKESVKKIIWDFIDNNNYHDETYSSSDDDNLFEMFDDYYNYYEEIYDGCSHIPPNRSAFEFLKNTYDE